MSPDPATTTPCIKCGVGVPNGYVKCPRCHAVLPTAPRPRRESMRDAVAGGTSAMPEPDGGGFPWLFAAICAAAAIAAIVWYVSSGGARAAEPAGNAPGTNGAAIGSASMPVVGSVGAVASGGRDVEPSAPAVDPRPRQRSEALAALAHTLESDQLWATVTEAGGAIEIRSSFCADRGVGARVDAARATLAELGFDSVRCLEKSGSPVWKRALP